MNPTILDEKDTEFVWHNEESLQNRPTTLLVFQQNERGFATFLAGMGLVGEAKPVCSIFSKLFDISCFNSAPEPSFPEWRMYEIYDVNDKRVWVLRLTHTAPLPKNNAPDTTWLYTYPIVRDIIRAVLKRGVDSLLFMTANQIQSSLGYEEDSYIYLEDDQLASFDYKKPEEVPTVLGYPIDKDIIVTAPVWHFNNLFKIYLPDSKSNEILFCGCSRKDFVQRDVADVILNHLATFYHLDRVHYPMMDKVTDLLSDIEGLTHAQALDSMNSDGGFKNEWV